MKSKRWLLILGFALYLAVSIINRFVVSLPDAVFIPCVIVGLSLVITDTVLDRRRCAQS